MDIDVEALILSISLIISVICLIVGLIRGLKAAQTLGGGVLTMVMTWLIFIALLMAGYALLYFIGITQDEKMLKTAANIFLLFVPICLLRITWGFADYVTILKKMSDDD